MVARGTPQYWRGQQQATKSTFVPGCNRGINAIDGLGEMHPQECLYTYNLMPDEYGMRLRKGYREWATGITGAVRTIIPYDGNQLDGSTDKMFAASEDGIWDVSLEGTDTPTKALDFTIKNQTSGQGVFTHFTTPAGEIILLYADESNGLFEYNEGTGLWAQAADPTGTGDTPPTAANIVFIMSHKNRLWFVGRNQSDVWYFEPNAYTGDATRFVMAGKMKHGGYTAGLWNWTMDGGDGFDDYLVIIGQAGDVIVYRGIDPEATDGWDLVGMWFIGTLPAGRRIASEYGGELNILSSMGIITLHSLLTEANRVQEMSPSYKISRLVRQLIDNFSQEPSWQLRHSPSNNFMMIVIPPLASEPDIQYGMDLTTKGWGTWRGVPMNCCDNWKGDFFIGTQDGRVLQYDGAYDDTKLDGTLGEPIEFSLFSTYQHWGEPSRFKRVQFMRPKGIITDTTTINIRPFYDFVINPFVPAPAPVTPSNKDLWDQGLWDQAVWSGVQGGAETIRGGRNMGTHFALAMRGEAADRLTFIGWDIMWDTGGYL